MSLFLALRFVNQSLTVWRILDSLVSGSLISILTVSIVIPKNVSDVDGPSTFSAASGTPKALHVCFIVSKLF